MTESSGNLLHNLILFGRVLRGLGLDVSPERILDLVRGLEYIEIGRKSDFYHAARSLLVHRREDLPLFDAAFELFWRKPAEGWTTLDLRALGERRRYRRPTFTPRPPQDARTASSREGKGKLKSEDRSTVLEATLTYSPREVLQHKDFAELTGEELQAVEQLISQLDWRLGEKRRRRQQPGKGQHIDLRHTLRDSLRYGGEVFVWGRRRHGFRPRTLVVIADISGSMERYTRLLLHFIYGLGQGLTQLVEAFVFSTRLTRITRQLHGRDLERALREVSRSVPDWSGGTRIGEALRSFNYNWARRVLGRGAVVLLISDGWDRGDVQLLHREMARLQRSCFRLIWLNPLLGSPEYEPLARGMQAALPYVDDFLPVHNLASLDSLAEHLGQIGDRRPFRRQQRTVGDHDAHLP